MSGRQQNDSISTAKCCHFDAVLGGNVDSGIWGYGRCLDRVWSASQNTWFGTRGSYPVMRKTAHDRGPVSEVQILSPRPINSAFAFRDLRTYSSCSLELRHQETEALRCPDHHLSSRIPSTIEGQPRYPYLKPRRSFQEAEDRIGRSASWAHHLDTARLRAVP